MHVIFAPFLCCEYVQNVTRVYFTFIWDKLGPKASANFSDLCYNKKHKRGGELII